MKLWCDGVETSGAISVSYQNILLFQISEKTLLFKLLAQSVLIYSQDCWLIWSFTFILDQTNYLFTCLICEFLFSLGHLPWCVCENIAEMTHFGPSNEPVGFSQYRFVTWLIFSDRIHRYMMWLSLCWCLSRKLIIFRALKKPSLQHKSCGWLMYRDRRERCNKCMGADYANPSLVVKTIYGHDSVKRVRHQDKFVPRYIRKWTQRYMVSVNLGWGVSRAAWNYSPKDAS